MKIFAANWKMNNAFDETDAWLEGFYQNLSKKYDQLKTVEMVLCPPAILLDYIDSEIMDDSLKGLEEIMRSEKKEFEDFSPEELNKILVKNRALKLGGQNCHHESSGSFTGDVSASMIAKVGCEYVILGHSERRGLSLESNEIIAKKVKTALLETLTPIICVGETKEIRDQGQHLEFVYQQVIDSIPQDVEFDKLIIAYEPIWSIGTGVIPSESQISEMVAFLQKTFNEKFATQAKEFFILYGGSVTSENSPRILAIDGIGGLLVGKASLDIEEFIKICTS